jgi:RHS repeat-associated protein
MGLGAVWSAGLTYGADSANNGNVMSQTITANGVSFPQSYGYDAFNRLTSASEGSNWSRGFSYDAFGNMWATGTGVPLDPSTPQASSNYNSKNQLLINSAAYDAAGNQTAIAGFTNTFDAENRLASSTIGGVTTSYTYDGDGRRVMKSSGSAQTVYVYDATGGLAAEYTNGTPPATPCVTCYLTADHLGSTRVMTDSSGTVQSLHDYLPFGEEIQARVGARVTGLYPQATLAVGDGVTEKFTGKERDTETGLDFFGARYFSGAQGRFTSPDPITVTPARVADPQQLNLYAYARNDPLKFVDPTGMVINTDDLSDDDKKLWQKVKDLANKQDENGNYVNPALHAAYDALDSDSRVFRIEDNPGLGSARAGLFTITKFNGDNDFSEARIDLNFKTIKGICSTTTGNFDPSFQKYSGLLGGNGFIPRLAETFGHEANHGIFAQQDPAGGVALQKLLLGRDAAIAGSPQDKHGHTKYPLPPDVMQKIQGAEEALVPTERFAQQAEKTINGELKASQVK